MRRTGGCLCGAIQYSCDLTTTDVVACHCEQCRRQSGHVWASVPARGDTLEIDAAETLRWRRERGAERGFCGRCGSSLFWRADGSPDVSIGAGTLDDTSGLRLKAEIYVAEKSAYAQPAAGVEVYSGDRGDPPLACAGAAKR